MGVRCGHGLDDNSQVRARRREDVGSDEFVVLMFAAPHPSQRAGMQDEVGRTVLEEARDVTSAEKHRRIIYYLFIWWHYI